jgi:hypothetical protein
MAGDRTRIKQMDNFIFCIALFCAVQARADLQITESAPKTSGNKSVLKLTLKNTFTVGIESARATMFLFDDSGKMVGQKTQWIIGGSKERLALEPNNEAEFNFVVSADKPFTKTKLSVTRVVLTGGQTADVAKQVQIESPKPSKKE